MLTTIQIQCMTTEVLTNKELNEILNRHAHSRFTPLAPHVKNLLYNAVRIAARDEALRLLNKSSYIQIGRDTPNRRLIELAAANHQRALSLLLLSSPDESKPTLLGETLLHQAVLNNDIHLATELLDAGIDKNRGSSYGETPLYYAAAKGNTELVSLLLRAGADKNIANHKEETPLSRAIRNGHIEVVLMLLIDGEADRVPPSQAVVGNLSRLR